MTDSIWTASAGLPEFPRLRGNLKTDVLIIGGGLTGLLCAYMLNKANVSCVLLEADRLCGGITKNTTAKLTSQHGLIYHKLSQSFGKEKAQMYLHANQQALKAYRELCKSIPCDFTEKDAFVYSARPGDIEEELNALHRLGYPAEFSSSLPIPLQNISALRFKRQAQFHPLKFADGIARGLPIYEHSPVRQMVGCTAITDLGRVRAEKVIVATHFPFLNKHGMYFLKLYQQRSYVLGLEGAPDVGGMYIGAEENSLSFRNAQGLLLLGGGGHRTGKTGGNWSELRSFAQAHYPGAVAKFQWATQDCMTLDGVPYIGQYSKNTPNLYVATGFNKWGMTNAMAAATILTDLVQGRSNPYAPVFDPSRSILRPQLFVNGWESASNLLRFSKKRCPHLGCALKWNPQERTWDCPCHGSRFTAEGKRIDNPATGDL